MSRNRRTKIKEIENIGKVEKKSKETSFKNLTKTSKKIQNDNRQEKTKNGLTNKKIFEDTGIAMLTEKMIMNITSLLKDKKANKQF